ncbi:DUF3298 domain-containing protein [Flavobacterium terrigena]|uniref:DUF3298 domain-containing protein n=1 Tax=Flavobacterium terrigena TaxID=402734 RepID=A0A1H6UV18_9FLAO|nr:DUF3298 domain-containing protein [Flavobacterium terrigena]SEI94484.1 hypothetical protein SAMN05660918_2002 [Flavobacterium terrigena]
MKNTIFILLLFLLTGCSQQLVFERKQYNSSYSPNYTTSYNSANIKMEVLEAKNDDNINKIIFENIKELSSFIDSQNLTINNYNQLTKGFVDTYKNAKNKTPGNNIKNWDFELESNIEYETEEFVNIGINYTSSYGDASGFGGKRSLVFNKQTGNQLKLEDIFINPKAVSKLVEAKFRDKYHVNNAVSLNQQGYCFETGSFYLTNNVFFNIEGVKFLYNINEISSYDKGSYEVFLTYQEIDKYLLIK